MKIPNRNRFFLLYMYTMFGLWVEIGYIVRICVENYNLFSVYFFTNYDIYNCGYNHMNSFRDVHCWRTQICNESSKLCISIKFRPFNTFPFDVKIQFEVWTLLISSDESQFESSFLHENHFSLSIHQFLVFLLNIWVYFSKSSSLVSESTKIPNKIWCFNCIF